MKDVRGLRERLRDRLASEGKGSRRLVQELDEALRRAEEDQASLKRALELTSDLLRRNDALASSTAQKPRRSELAKSLRRLFLQAPFAAVCCDRSLRVTAWNPAAQRLLGHAPQDAMGRELPVLLAPPLEQAAVDAALRGTLSRGETSRETRTAAARDGRTMTCDWQLVPLKSLEGKVRGLAVLLSESQPDRSALALDSAGDAAFDWDLHTQRLWLSQRFREMVGALEPLDGSTAWLERVHPEDREALQTALDAHLSGQSPRLEHEHRVRHADGSWRWVLARGAAQRDAQGKATRLAGTYTDVTERRAQQERMLHDALHDPLTGLPNRALFHDLVKRSFARARRREGYRFAVLFLDLDRFKTVNDGLGHAVGDELLVQVGQRLQTCLREGDTLARHGGDEFTILLDDVKEPQDAGVVADRIHQVTSESFDVSGHQVSSTASIGIALSAASYSKPEDLLRDADTAMYRAKAQGRARAVVFDSAMRERGPELLQLEADLRRALLRDEFRLHYLPIIDVGSGRISGLEALIRWAHPKKGMVQPEQFVPFAEETGLIVPIGQWVMGAASREYQGWRKSGATGVTLNVNLSSKQLLHSDLMQQMEKVLQETEIDPHDVALEVTETAFQHSDLATQRLGQLKARGFRLYMDDFGTGYSSLNSLYRFQLDSLKIDRSLFRGGSPRGQAPELVKTIVSFARDLGKQVIAEGVETADQLRFVKEIGCFSAQGFFFSPPVDGSTAKALLERAPNWASAR
jgi:diguanylate cyclase (GGDEF)-like protein/PAS domain S-box-containing protein